MRQPPERPSARRDRGWRRIASRGVTLYVAYALAGFFLIMLRLALLAIGVDVPGWAAVIFIVAVMVAVYRVVSDRTTNRSRT